MDKPIYSVNGLTLKEGQETILNIEKIHYKLMKVQKTMK